MQIPGVDYDEVCSAVAMLKSFRILMAISASLGFIVKKLDFKNAHVQEPLKKTVYMRHSDGFPGPAGTCLKLLKSLYGLVEASKLWAFSRPLKFENNLKCHVFNNCRFTWTMVKRIRIHRCTCGC